MTKNDDDKIKKIEQALIDSFRVEREVSINPQWCSNVMQDVRGLEVDRGVPSDVVWRFVTVSCCIAVVSVLVAAGVGINPQDSLAGLLISDPLGTMQPFLW
ncbi:MAG: hypothetical protein HQL04_02740 [Nitrospirae bacterium]|nr:hypothetical protein [Nitrospirota bacterium]